jgi:hypothetical protein
VPLGTAVLSQAGRVSLYVLGFAIAERVRVLRCYDPEKMSRTPTAFTVLNPYTLFLAKPTPRGSSRAEVEESSGASRPSRLSRRR